MPRYLILTAIALMASPVTAKVIGFEDLVLQQQYDLNAGTPASPTSFTSAGVDIDLSQYFFSNGTPTSNGSARVQSAGMAGGVGKELWVSNVNLNFDFRSPIQQLKLNFGEFGGNINLQVNGSQQNAQNFQNLPASIGGVAFSVSPTNTAGSMITLLGTINSFSIGGQEFAIDSFVYRVPEPSTLALFAIGCAAIGYRRRRFATAF